MNGITPEAREAAAQVVADTISARMGSFGSQGAPFTEDYDLVDALIAAGWGPVSAPVRPTVEALVMTDLTAPQLGQLAQILREQTERPNAVAQSSSQFYASSAVYALASALDTLATRTVLTGDNR